MMWKQTDSAEEMVPSPKPETHPAKSRTPATIAKGRAIIGPTIAIHGDVSGEEDLLIEGRVEGRVELAHHHLVVGATGKVKAEVYGRSVTIEGELEGNLRAGEQVIVRKSGRVQGDMVTPRMTIEDGATLNGTVDMDVQTPAHPVRDPAATPSVVRFAPEGRAQSSADGDGLGETG